jgi:hypothetical protein
MLMLLRIWAASDPHVHDTIQLTYPHVSKVQTTTVLLMPRVSGKTGCGQS